MAIAGVIKNLHEPGALATLFRVDKASNLQLSVRRQASADNTGNRKSATNGSNLLLPGWRDIKLPPPKLTARAFLPAVNPGKLCLPGFLFFRASI
ncbi:hypothetical protein [Hydrogenophaga sp. 2FB]|uniref:hypothetical protein n=1 Tax=Hydrogenophaga sp. 2FB TaxID=2502187 RepID=UPI0010F4D6F7|nr:hypothetical protein [Hydrogenophaga sp. 2FB]